MENYKFNIGDSVYIKRDSPRHSGAKMYVIARRLGINGPEYKFVDRYIEEKYLVNQDEFIKENAIYKVGDTATVTNISCPNEEIASQLRKLIGKPLRIDRVICAYPDVEYYMGGWVIKQSELEPITEIEDVTNEEVLNILE